MTYGCYDAILRTCKREIIMLLLVTVAVVLLLHHLEHVDIGDVIGMSLLL